MAETKTKLPFITSGTLGLLTLAFALSIEVITPSAKALKSETIEIKPQVLGAYTEVPAVIRGEPQSLVVKPKLSAPFNFDNIDAKSVLVYDQASGELLAEKNKGEKLPIASLTKLMTGLIAYEQLNVSATTTVPNIWYVKDNPVLNLRPGDELKIADVFNAMLIGSENDAAQMLAKVTELQTGKNFIELMNQKAELLGMVNTEYANPTGFYSEHNYSTAEDLQKLVNETQKYPAFQDIGRKTSYIFDGKFGNRYYSTATNKLIKAHSDIYAIKTGYTKESQGSLITKIDLHGHKVIVIVLGTDDREGDTLKLKKQIEELVMW